MKIAGLLSSVACLLAVASCDDAPPPAPPSTPAQEVARVPIVGTSSRGMPGVISISPDGTRVALPARVATGGGAGGGGHAAAPQSAHPAAIDNVAIYNAATRQFEQPALPVPPNQQLVAVHFSPDGRFELGVFVGGRPYREIRVFRAQDMGEMFVAQTDMTGLAPITFSPDGKWLLHAAPPDAKGQFALRVINVVSGAPRATIAVEMRTIARGAFRNAGFSPDGNFAYAHQADHLFVWNANDGKLMTEWQWLGYGDVTTMGAAPDNSAIRALMQDGTIATIDLPAANNVRPSRLDVPAVPGNHPRHVPFDLPWSFSRAAFAPDGASVLRDGGGRIDVFDLASGGRFTRAFALPPNAAQVNFAARHGPFVPVWLRGAGGEAIAIVRLPQ